MAKIRSAPQLVYFYHTPKPTLRLLFLLYILYISM